MNQGDQKSEITDKIFGLAHGLRLQKGGVVGRLCYVAIAILVVGSVLVWSIPEDQRIWMILGLGILEALVIVLIFRYGIKHPHVAILEGAEIIRREELIIAAKGQATELISLSQGDVIADPYPVQNKLTLTNDSKEGDDE